MEEKKQSLAQAQAQRTELANNAAQYIQDRKDNDQMYAEIEDDIRASIVSGAVNYADADEMYSEKYPNIVNSGGRHGHYPECCCNACDPYDYSPEENTPITVTAHVEMVVVTGWSLSSCATHGTVYHDGCEDCRENNFPF